MSKAPDIPQLKFEVGQPLHLQHKKKPLTKTTMSGFIVEKKVLGSPKKTPKISIQITAYNEGEGLLGCLDSISKSTYENFEVVLVDNGLDQYTVSSLSAYDLIYIKSVANIGCTAGRNVGSVHSRGELMMFIDADGIVDKNTVKNAVKVMSDKSIVAARGKVLPLENGGSMPSHYDLGTSRGPSIISTEGNSIWRTKDYNKVGGFEADLAGAEGLVLCYRMVKLYGYNVDAFIYDPSFILYHDFHADAGHLKKKLYRQSVIRDAVTKKYPDIKEFERLYAKKGLKPNITKDFSIASAAEKAREGVASDYLKIYSEKSNLRKATPGSVKDGDFDFSVVIPCFNLGGLLLEAVESVRYQSIDRVQIIVVDDVSTDDETIKILSELESQVHVIYSNKNGGVARARNTGIKKARGKYILCLDADDTIEPTYLEKAKNMFDMDKSTDIVTCWAQYHGATDATWKPRQPLDIERALIGSPIPTASCFRRKTWEEVGGYEERIRGYEDWELWINIIKRGGQVAVIPELLFNYLVRPGSKVNTSNKNADKILAVFFEKHRDVFVEHLETVYVEKHREISRLRNENRQLRSKSYKTYILNSPAGPVAKKAKNASALLGRHMSELKEDAREHKSPIKTTRGVYKIGVLGVRKIRRSVGQ